MVLTVFETECGNVQLTDAAMMQASFYIIRASLPLSIVDRIWTDDYHEALENIWKMVQNSLTFM